MEIKVLGTGCPKCKKLEQLAQDAIADLGIEASIEKVEDIQKIMDYGVMATPALVLNGEVVVRGRLPKAKEIKSLLSK